MAWTVSAPLHSLRRPNEPLGPSKNLLSRGLAGERHVSSDDPATRRLYSFSQSTQVRPPSSSRRRDRHFADVNTTSLVN